MINQRAYPDILLGFGTTQSIAGYGCYMISLYDELKKRGLIAMSVQEWNQFLKDRGVFTPTNPTLLSASTLALKIPELFLEGRSEGWTDTGIIKYIVGQKVDYIVLGEVDARGIGGTGQHFVKIDSVDSLNGKISMTYIDDPWDGLENQKVTTRYNSFGNIKSLRVFKINIAGGSMATVQVDSKKFEELVGKSTQRDNVWNYLGLTPVTDDKGAISVIAGLKSRITDLGNQLSNVLDLDWKGSDGETRKLNWYVAEAVNRTEQVSRLKEQLLSSESDKNTLSVQLKKLQAGAGAEQAYWTGRIGDLEKSNTQLGVEKGALNQTIVDMQTQEQSLKIKIDTLTEQLEAQLSTSVNQLSLPQLISAVVKKLLSGNWS